MRPIYASSIFMCMIGVAMRFHASDSLIYDDYYYLARFPLAVRLSVPLSVARYKSDRWDDTCTLWPAIPFTDTIVCEEHGMITQFAWPFSNVRKIDMINSIFNQINSRYICMRMNDFIRASASSIVWVNAKNVEIVECFNSRRRVRSSFLLLLGGFIYRLSSFKLMESQPILNTNCRRRHSQSKHTHTATRHQFWESNCWWMWFEVMTWLRTPVSIFAVDVFEAQIRFV